MQPAIRVENLSKQFRIGAQAMVKGDYHTLRDTLVDAVKAPFRRLRNNGQSARQTDFWALQDVSFEVKPGEVIGIIGRNGAGKSTLLKILSRIVEPTTGRAEVRGRLSSLLEVGTGFHPELTGRENIYLNGSILGMSHREIQRKFDEIVAFSEIEKFLDTPVKRYSSGMYVRLAFAVAAHLEPDILIIDEVLAVGDMGFQRKCIGKMSDVATHGRTVLFVSHNLAAIQSLCSRCLYLESGCVEMDGPTREVSNAYLVANNKATIQQKPPTVRGDKHRGETASLHYNGDLGVIRMYCGEDIALRFRVQAPKAIDSACIGFTVIGPDGVVVAAMDSQVQNVRSKTGHSEVWEVHCDLGRFPLNAGTYTLSVYFSDENREIARFSNAFAIEVLARDVFGWGRELPSSQHWGHFYWAPDWTIRPAR